MPHKAAAIRLALAYAALALLWIWLSDYAVFLVSADAAPETLLFQAGKGSAFVLVTATLLYLLSRRILGRMEAGGRAHQEAETRLRALLTTLPHGVEEIGLDGTILFSNAAHHRMHGYLPGELLGREMWCLVPEEERAGLSSYFATLLREQPTPSPWEGVGLCRDGRRITVRVDWDYRRDADGRVAGFVGIVTDVTAQRLAEERLQEAATVFNAAAEGIVILDGERRLLRCNQAFETLSGYRRSELAGRVPELLTGSRREPLFDGAVLKTLQRSGRWQGEGLLLPGRGDALPLWLSISAIRDDGGGAVLYVLVCSDLRAAKESEQRIEHLTHYDPVTGLGNRLLLEARLAHTLERARHGTQCAGLLMVDVDRFKHINETFGHGAGDEVLHEIGTRLRHCIGDDSTIARFGGDEFAVVLEDDRSVRDAGRVAERIGAVMEPAIRVGDQEVYCTVGIGIALFPNDGSSAEVLTRNAEAAMFRAKEAGRNNYQFYTEELTHRAAERLSLEASLRRAIEHEDFVLHYQPQYAADGRPVACEALIRWQHPELGLIAPGKFIPLAEESGLIVPLTRWVLRSACIEARRWQQAGLALRVAVNISGVHLVRPDFLDDVDAALHDSGLPPQRLELEITESALMTRAADAVANLDALRKCGVCLAIDDFGTGYSSMSYLKRFAVHTLKVDQSFVRDIPHDPNDCAIATAIIAMGHHLGLAVLAEGVETEEQRRFLIDAGCNMLQGYLLSRPVPAERIRGFAADAAGLSSGEQTTQGDPTMANDPNGSNLGNPYFAGGVDATGFMETLAGRLDAMHDCREIEESLDHLETIIDGLDPELQGPAYDLDERLRARWKAQGCSH